VSEDEASHSSPGRPQGRERIHLARRNRISTGHKVVTAKPKKKNTRSKVLTKRNAAVLGAQNDQERPVKRLTRARGAQGRNPLSGSSLLKIEDTNADSEIFLSRNHRRPRVAGVSLPSNGHRHGGMSLAEYRTDSKSGRSQHGEILRSILHENAPNVI